jgi:hypothetical protein
VKPVRLVAFLVTLTLLTGGIARAQTSYRIQPIVSLGDPVGGVRIKPNGAFFVGGINDSGQVLFVADSAGGGQMLVQYADDQLIPIAMPGGNAPGGTWSPKVSITCPVSINRFGSAVFAADVTAGGQSAVEMFRWEAEARQVTPVMTPGIAAVRNLTFATGGGSGPTINDRNEIALVAAVRSADGKAGNGVFYLGEDGRPQPVALPDEALPDGGQILLARMPSLNDAGVMALLARSHMGVLDRLLIWERGALSQIPPPDAKTLGSRHLVSFTGIWVNNQNPNVLLAAHLHDLSGASNALYLFTGGGYMPVVVPGQRMPGGGVFQTIQPQDPGSQDTSLATGVSAANDMGQHVVVAALADRLTTAAYRMDPDGKLSLILKSGMSTPLGPVVSVGQGTGGSQGVGLNSKGQVVLPVKFAGHRDALVLLTPPAP